MFIHNLSGFFKQFQNVKNLSIKFNCKNTFHTNRGKSSKPNLNSFEESQKKRIKSTVYYVTATGVIVVGLSYAAVPIYRMFCQAYSYGGIVSTGHDASKVETMSVIKSKPFKIKFNADTAASMRWNFKPQQSEIKVGNNDF